MVRSPDTQTHINPKAHLHVKHYISIIHTYVSRVWKRESFKNPCTQGVGSEGVGTSEGCGTPSHVQTFVTLTFEVPPSVVGKIIKGHTSETMSTVKYL